MNMLKVLGSQTRQRILKILSERDMHLSGLARELGISTPVTARHCKILEKSGLIKRKIFGKTHVFELVKINLENMLESLIFCETHEIEIEESSNILEILKKVGGVEIKKSDGKEFLVSVDGEKGFYIYEVDNKMPELPIGEYIVNKDTKLVLKKLVPIKKKEIRLRFKKAKNINKKNEDIFK